jgi:hypothetical protein
MRVLSLGSHSGFSLPRARGRSHQKGLVMNARLVFRGCCEGVLLSEGRRRFRFFSHLGI